MNVFTGRSTPKKRSSALYVDRELEQIIAQNHQTYLASQLDLAQQLSSSDNILNPDSLLGPLHSNYQNLIHSVDYYISGDAHKSKAESDVLDAQSEKEDLERDLEEKIARASFLKAKLKEYLSAMSLKFKSWNKVKIMLWIMLSLEILVNYKMFALVGGSLLSNLALAGLTCLAIFYYAEYVAELIRPIQHRLRKFLVSLLSNLPVIVIFALLAHLRTQYLTLEHGQDSTSSGVIVYLLPLINCFVYSVCVNMIEKYKPTSGEFEIYHTYKIHKDELDTLKLSIKNTRSSITDCDKILREKIQEHYSYLLLGRNTERQIVTLYQSTFAQYKAEFALRSASAKAQQALQTISLPELSLNYQHVQPENLI